MITRPFESLAGQTGKPIVNKAFEICYAVFRIAGTLNDERSLAESIKRHSLRLLEGSIANSRKEMEKEMEALEYLLRIGENTGLIYPIHSQTVINEMIDFRSFLASLPEVSKEVPDLDLGSIFTPLPEDRKGGFAPITKDEIGRFKYEEEIQKVNQEIDKEVAEEDPQPEFSSPQVVPISSPKPAASINHVRHAGNGTSARERQEKILNRIRQFERIPREIRGDQEGCRLKDLQDVLPGTSERTLRYDLQTLMEQGTIERFGSGGPKTFYRTLPTIAGSNPAKENPARG